MTVPLPYALSQFKLKSNNSCKQIRTIIKHSKIEMHDLKVVRKAISVKILRTSNIKLKQTDRSNINLHWSLHLLIYIILRKAMCFTPIEMSWCWIILVFIDNNWFIFIKNDFTDQCSNKATYSCIYIHFMHSFLSLNICELLQLTKGKSET